MSLPTSSELDDRLNEIAGLIAEVDDANAQEALYALLVLFTRIATKICEAP